MIWNVKATNYKHLMSETVTVSLIYRWAIISVYVHVGDLIASIDRARLAEKSARKDEKTLFWPPPTSLIWLPNRRETKQRRNK